ncbi:conserved hypothetical protein [Gluconacetobacter diazotrophicus PA1 5]|uniref:DNA transfer protein n=1 Tax=Gluconacetobacter diazotrophicus TaxID=33996 RepID=A0A7W4I5Y0_GLUDI|nr:hypothetical protein [Gluconacetobacter diazotrophicus]ACI52314.1 conserved hypothetical protein [Gluconacetobacter diazotrophicus PA1 5]MBB2156865.1 hypothetical protein [Gluconacetobacter diazotrophicus]TWB04791.1 hypothetical protein FBZ86_11913 [Gluconacetobacter diazotrophicus]
MTSIIGGVAGGVGSLVSGLMGSGAEKKAAEQEAQVEQNALNYDQGIYNTATTNLSPYVSTGTNALYSLADLMGLGGGSNGQGAGALAAYNQYTQTPYYTFPLQQGEQALNQAAAAKGLSLSGGQLSALGNYAQNYASQNFGNYMTALQQLAGQGSSAAGTLASAGANAASTDGSIASRLASALAGGTIGSTSALANGIAGLLGGLGSSTNLSALLSSVGGGTSYSDPFGGGGTTATGF